MNSSNQNMRPVQQYMGRPLRLPTHSYGWTGTYFVAIWAEGAGPVFAIPEVRAILEENWHALTQPFPGLILDAFAILPDHVQCIISLEGNTNRAMTLGRVIEAYKSLTAVSWLRYMETIGRECPGRLWQRNYFERVIHDASELEQVRQYIRGFSSNT